MRALTPEQQQAVTGAGQSYLASYGSGGWEKPVLIGVSVLGGFSLLAWLFSKE
jgi:hypothetical protein